MKSMKPGPSLQFIDDNSREDAGFLVWCDMTKLGRLSNHDLTHTVDIIASVLQRKPTHSAAFLVAPHLPSEKVVGGLRGERRFFGPRQDLNLLWF